MPRKKRGQAHKYPPKIDATAEEMAQAVFQLPPKPRSGYRDVNRFRCGSCKRSVHYPETLYRDGLCERCKAGAAAA